MSSTNSHISPRMHHALKVAALAAGAPVVAALGFSAVSHGVYHRSDMATMSEMYQWLKGYRKRVDEPIAWDNYILNRASANEEHYSVPKVVDFHYKIMGFRVSIQETDLKSDAGSMQVFMLNRREINDRAVIYLHGGAFLDQPTSNHWHFLDTVARDTRAEIIVPLYPLAPVHHWKEAYALLDALYDQVVQKYGAENVTLMGDEAGGGMAAGYAEELLQRGKLQPSHLILISPWMDITFSNPLANAIQPHDPLLSTHGMEKVGRLWAHGTDPYDYHLSPVNGEVRGLHNVLVFAGTREILYPDAKLFFARVQATGAHAEFVEGRGLNNNYPLYPIPEATKAIQKICNEISMN
ncbi:MAG: alpha/beta hydrolase [Coriobacteriales bacterium]|nr:alpha/beta hydrolase [Coriobacteriales bacterium]